MRECCRWEWESEELEEDVFMGNDLDMCVWFVGVWKWNAVFKDCERRVWRVRNVSQERCKLF